MELGRRGSFLLCFLLPVLVSQNLVTPVSSRSLQELTDKKNHVHFPKNVEPDCDCPTTPSHGGGGGSPIEPTPTPTPLKPTPTPSHGGGSTPSSPAKPTPSHGGGGYYHSPPTAPIIVPPVTPVNPTPSSPSVPDPHGPPFSPGTCNYWSTHPGAIWAIFGYWGSIGQMFGAACGSAFGSSNLSLPDALKNTRTDGIGALYREGTAALLNSFASRNFPYSSQQVKDAFASAIVSDKAAADQAQLFKLANEGKAKQ